MKKFVVSILAIFYLGVSSGATVYFHYCMGQLVESGLVSKKSSKCSKCGMKAAGTKACCKHESKRINIDSVQKLAGYSKQFQICSTDLIRNKYFSFREIYTSSLTKEPPHSNAPPNSDKAPVFIFNCNFRI